MRCPYCGHGEDKVIDSRAVQDGRGVRRRRECVSCEKRYTTYEYIERVELRVLKQDGHSEPYDRSKLIEGIRLACKKRPVSDKKISAMVDEIERNLHNLSRAEVSSQQIGETVMDMLRKTDEIAYVRFASVYRKFQDKTEFMAELKRLLE